MESVKILKSRLANICQNYKFAQDEKPNNLVIEAPYIPFIPENWHRNKVLILFESQNLSGARRGNKNYLKELTSKDSSTNKVMRLYNNSLGEGRLGILPWDASFLDLPLKVCFPTFDRNDFAVGNSVLWSLASNKKNISPSSLLIELSSMLWKVFLEEIDPNIIITVGNVADSVIKKTKYSKCIIINTFFPYGRYASFIHKHFNFTSEVSRYQEVQIALEALNKTLNSPISSSNSVHLSKTLPMAISLLFKINQKRYG